MHATIRTLLTASIALGLAACSEKDRLTSAAWTCQPNEETRIVMTFKPDNTLEAKLTMAEPPGKAAQPMSVAMDLTGQWVLKEEGRLDFAFRKASVTEATRGGQPMDEGAVSFYRDMFQESPKTMVNITSLTGKEFVYKELSSTKAVSCTR
jgi:hypothetical protein